jgi:hypothetical protein
MFLQLKYHSAMEECGFLVVQGDDSAPTTAGELVSMNVTTVSIDVVQQPAAQIDQAALDVILTHLERRYGFDPRIDRAYRIVVSDRVDLSIADPKAGLVHGDSGRSYWATVEGFCECPDAERVARCKHSLAVVIAIQLAAVARANVARASSSCMSFALATAASTRRTAGH